MLAGAWIGATLCSLPQVSLRLNPLVSKTNIMFQMVVFHVESHPNVTWYMQCVTYNVFPTPAHELTYLLFGMVMMYALPLAVIIFSYAAILMEICRRTRNPYGGKIFENFAETLNVQKQRHRSSCDSG